MVRNVDGMIFGEHRARAAIDLPTSLTGRGGPEFQKVLDAIAAGEVDAHYLHLAEGMRDNERSQKEFGLLADTLKGLTKATVIIHGTALSRDQLGQAADAGARLVWSPQSNLRLYGETTRAGDALDVGLPMALGADWLPSGSMSLLGEMKVARQQLVEQDHPVTAKDLVTMVTSGAADVAALGGKLGSLEVGRVADLVVMARQDDDAYESVCDSTPGRRRAGDDRRRRGLRPHRLGHPARRRRHRPRPRAGGRLGPVDAARHQLRGRRRGRPDAAARPRSGRRSPRSTRRWARSGPDSTDPRFRDAGWRSLLDRLRREPFSKRRTYRARCPYPRHIDGGDHRCCAPPGGCSCRCSRPLPACC